MSKKMQKNSCSECKSKDVHSQKSNEKDMIERKKQTTEFGKDYYEQVKDNSIEPNTENK